jgi:hypothetical protein
MTWYLFVHIPGERVIQRPVDGVWYRFDLVPHEPASSWLGVAAHDQERLKRLLPLADDVKVASSDGRDALLGIKT